jgi:hypothetical protein
MVAYEVLRYEDEETGVRRDGEEDLYLGKIGLAC